MGGEKRICDELDEERERLVDIAVHATEPVASELSAVVSDLERLRRRAADLQTAFEFRKAQVLRLKGLG